MLKILGIIGNPIEHSLSPVMQNAALRAMNLPYLYLTFRVRPKELSSFVQQARHQGLSGFNVTIPHKEKILKYLDWISPEAKAIGAVNTVTLKGGKFHGYNTDALGYLKSLQVDARLNPRGKKILVLGAGGAARSVVYTLAKAGAKEILVSNRTVRRADRLVKEFKKFSRRRLGTLPLRKKDLIDHIASFDLIVNTTSVGLKGERLRELPLAQASRRTIVSDLIYRPLWTPLLRDAAKRRLRVHPGWGMLLHQGAESLKIWTGKKPNVKVMQKALLDALR